MVRAGYAYTGHQCARRERTRRAGLTCARRRLSPVAVARVRLGALQRALQRALVSPWVLGPGVVLTAMVLALALIYIHVACLETGHDILLLQKRLAELEAENQRLQLQVVGLTSPDRIEQLARERLGMVRPEVARVLPEGVPAVAQSPAPVPVEVSWYGKMRTFLTRLVEGRGVLAEPAR